MTARPDGALPLYRQVREVVAARLAEGAYGPGDRLPSEPALAEELGVHRLTVRRALDELAREGRLEARQGSGTYVTRRAAPLTVDVPLTREEYGTTLRALIAEQGQVVRDVLLSVTTSDDATARADLGVPRAALRRVDSALEVDGERWLWSSVWAPARRLPDVEERWDEVEGVYGQVLAREPGPLRYVWRSFAAEPADAVDAEQLGMRAGAPVLVREGLTADATGKPLLRVRRRARADRVRYVLRYS